MTASPDRPGPGAADPSRSPDHDHAAQSRARKDRLRRGKFLALAAGLGLACAIVGGVAGGYVAVHTVASPNDSSYRLGTVPPALRDRPASSVAGIAARDTPSVVMIKVDGNQGVGSGFVIRGGYIVTDDHVITLDGLVQHASLRVYFSTGQFATALVVGADPYSDIAVLRAEGVTDLPALTLGNSAAVDVGDPVLAIGAPLGLADTVTSGIVSAVQRPVQPGGAAGGQLPQVFFDAIQTDAPINPGNSGGPLVNASGQVIGVDAAIDTLGSNPLTGTEGGNIGLGFAIPIDQARRVIDQLVRSGRATHAVIGASLNNGYGGAGAQIASRSVGGHAAVTPGGPAARAGLRAGDVITSFDGQAIASPDTLLDAISSLPPGAKVRITYRQQAQTRQTTLRLGSAPS